MFTRRGARRGTHPIDETKKFNVDIPGLWRRPENVPPETLLGAKRPLKAIVVSGWIACMVLFAVQCWYYISLTDDVFVIQTSPQLEGYTCAPLVLDATYGLNITYEECMATYYEAPTKDNVYNINENAEFNATAGSPGPWDFGSGGYEFPSTIPAYYHKPFPKLSRVAYAYHSSCPLPLYAGFESSDNYSPEFSSNNPLKVAYEASLANGANSFAGYGKYSIANEGISSTTRPESFTVADYKTFLFRATSESDQYVCTDQAASVVNDALVSEAKKTGALVFPRVHSAATDVPIPSQGVGESIAFKERSVGLTVTYPPNAMGSLNKKFAGQDLTTSERCSAYESQMAADAFNYIYTYCHPCDDFASNAPFICRTTKTKNEVLEVISLAVGNTFAVFDVIIIIVAAILIITPEKISGASMVERNTGETQTGDSAPAKQTSATDAV